MTNEFRKIPTDLLQLSSIAIVNELRQRGIGVEEMCRRIGLSEEVFWRNLS
jgi:hypothetical protein